MKYIFMPIFGALLGACGINVIDEPIKAIVLILFFGISLIITDALASNKS